MQVSMTPKVKMACVRCKLKGDTKFVYAEGFDHTGCYDYLRAAHSMYPKVQPEKYDAEEGFLLTNGDFVNRMVAMKIANKEGQLKPEYKGQHFPLLFSYMLYYKAI